MNEEIPIPDASLTPEQEDRVSRLSADDIDIIDKTILSNCIAQWRKVAMVVAKTLMILRERYSGIPDVFYSNRVRALVHDGELESQGNLIYMRFSEVRLPTKPMNNET